MKTWFRQWLPVLAITFMSIYFMRDLTRPGLPRMHDSNPHIARMIAYHQNIADGQFPPVWAKEVLGGIGSPVLLLNYQLPYYFSEILVQARVSYFDSYKLVLGLSFLLSGLAMYWALSHKYPSWASTLGASLYLLAPYRFVDIFVRGAYGEAWAFVFAPVVLAGFWRRSLLLLVLGWAGLFLTHPVASAAFAGFFLLYSLFNFKGLEKREILQKYWLSFGLALAISAFNILPTLTLTKYTYYTPEDSGTLLQFPTYQQLITSVWGYGTSVPGPGDKMSLAIGVGQLAVIIAATYLAWRKRNQTLRFVVATTWLAIFLITPAATGIYKLLELSHIIDFPWRLLICVVFAAGWLGAEIIARFPSRLFRYMVGIGLLALLIGRAIPIAHTGEYWDKPTSWFARETGDSYGEYAPRMRATRESAPFGLRAETIAGEMELSLIEHKTTKLVLGLEAKAESTVRINIAAFPGWQTWLDGQKLDCQITRRTLTHIDDSGLVTCPIPPGKHTLIHEYFPLPIQRMANLITLAGIGVYLWIWCRSYYLRITNGKRS